MIWRAVRRRVRRGRIARAVAGGATALVLVVVVVLALASRGDRGSVSEPTHGVLTSTTVPASSVIIPFDVPWVDRPAPPLVPPTPEPTTLPPTNARPCSAPDVSFSADGQNGGGGNFVYSFRVKNVGSATCLLGGYPSHVVASEPGYPDVVARDGAYFGDPGPAGNIGPGQAGLLFLTMPSYCPAAQDAHSLAPTYHTVVVTFSSGGEASMSVSLRPGCGLATSRFGVQLPQLVYPPQWYESVGGSMQVPPTVDAGTTLTYVVALTTATAKAVKIDPCVGYYEHGVDGPVEATGDFGLNCDTVHGIGAHGHVRYQMKLDVPADAPTGPMTVQWTISVPMAKPVTANATVQVRGNDHPCTTDQVRATAPDPASPFRGSGIYFVKDAGTALDVTVTNTSSTSCTLQGSPGVRVLSARGTDLGLKYVTHGLNFGPPPSSGSRVILAPGQSATSTLAWHSRWCAANPNPVRVTLILPTNSDVVTVNPAHGWMPPACNGFAWNSVSSAPFG